ncbi:hypothetical protein [Bradyrhizobium canariense]|uniref:hypothetical protein n=1 Tax=Bradyrhizobium canariense TaxID=255045 RepID=UPI001F0A8E76|nr:hypothetical protein [Bradyrhizobium canariense]
MMESNAPGDNVSVRAMVAAALLTSPSRGRSTPDLEDGVDPVGDEMSQTKKSSLAADLCPFRNGFLEHLLTPATDEDFRAYFQEAGPQTCPFRREISGCSSH